MSVYKTLIEENELLREILSEAQRDVVFLIESLEYGPDFVSKEDIIQRLGHIDLPPTED